MITKYNLSKIDILKIDVEGFELEVLKGIKKEDFPKIKQMIIEVENYREGLKDQIVQLLEAEGFSVKVEREENLWCDVIAKAV